MKNTFLITLFLVLTISVFGQNYNDSLTIELTNLVEQSDTPGFGVALVSKDSVLYSKGFGYADVEKKIPYTSQTIHNIGSVTKTTIAIALMKLLEEGELSLDDCVNEYLPFDVKNPNHPKVPITLRQLATHTSSLTDGKDDMLIERSYLFEGNIDFKEEELPIGYYPYFQRYQKNVRLSMGRFLHNVYCPDGEWYEKENFLNEAPGTKYQYSNIGATLLAYIIEEVSGKKFSDFTKEIIFDPLAMENSFWDINQIPSEKLASLYMSNGLKIPHYQLITYPDGGLFTCIDDFSFYLMEMIKGINGEGRLLMPIMYEEMMTNQLTAYNFPKNKFEETHGLFWDVNKDGDNISADGSDPGIGTYTIFTTVGNLGLVIFENVNAYGNESIDRDFYKIRNILFKYSSKLKK